MRRSILAYYLLVFSQLIGTAVVAQEAIVAKPEKTSMLLGEPLRITISITGGQPYEAAVGDSLGRFEVLEHKPPETSTKDGTVTTTEQITVTCFDSGVQRLPPIMVQGNPAVVSPGFDILVNTLPADAKVEYGDLKQIINMQPPSQWPYIAALASLVFISAFSIIRLNKKYNLVEGFGASRVENEAINNLPDQLSQLRKAWLQQQVEPVQLGNRLMQIFRAYLARKGVNSKTKTGEELVIATKGMYGAGQWQEIVQTIRLCNAMRFGKYQATQPEGTEGIDAFTRAITSKEGKEETATLSTQPGTERWQPSGR